MTARDRRVLLGLLGFLTFSAVYASVVMAPVLTQIAAEFDISTGTAGLTVSANAAPGIVAALIAGPYSDRFGRKIFLVGGSLLMGVFTIAGAFADSFPMLVGLRAVAGLGSAVLFPNSSATIGDNFPYRERGRAMSTVIGFNTMASIVGIPLAGIIAEATSWRVSLALVGVLAVVAGVLLAVWLRPARVHTSGSRAVELYRTIFTNRSAVAAVVSSFMGSLYWFTWVTYLVVFFQHTFGLGQGEASVYALTMGLGVLIGSQAGGRIGDRVGHRPVVAGTITTSGVLLLALTNVPTPLLVAAALSLLLSAVIGARFATNLTLLTEQVPEARGTLLALSSATVSVAIVAGAAVGGVLVDVLGFWAIGVFCLTAALLSSLVVILFVREEPVDMEIASA